MKHIPFVAFPRAEQEALLAALWAAGVAARGFCASRVEWADTPASAPDGGFALVTAQGLCRAYPAGAGLGWISALQRDLAAPLTEASWPA
jgi:hypothetical protein